MPKTPVLRITKDNFDKPAVTKLRQHFFPYEDYTKLIGVNQIKMDYAFYQANRRKWYCDVAYLSLAEAIEIAEYAMKRGIIDRLPSALTSKPEVPSVPMAVL